MFGRKNDKDAVLIDEPLELDAAAEEVLFLDDQLPAGAGQDELVEENGRRRFGALRSRREALVPVVTTTRERVRPAVAGARGRMGPAVGHARERIVPAVADARGRMRPAVAGARGRLVDTVAPAVAGAVSTAVSAAREGSLPSRGVARERSAAALAALRGEQLRSPRRWPLAVVSLLAGAAAGAVAGLLARRASAPGEPTYVPASTPSPSPAGPAGPVATESNLGWPEQLDESMEGSGNRSADEPVVVSDEVDLTMIEDSSETHKPTH